MGEGERIPWDRLMEDQDKFIDPEYLPVGLHLLPNHHLRKEFIKAILKHWTEREAEGKISLRFNKVDKADRCRKQAYTVADIVPTGKLDGGSQNSDEVNEQAQAGRAPQGEDDSSLVWDRSPGEDADGDQSGVSTLPKHHGK